YSILPRIQQLFIYVRKLRLWECFEWYLRFVGRWRLGMDSDSDNRHASMRWFYLQRVLNQSCRSDWSQIPIGLPTLI
ncbi:MAG: hypothetical protein ACK5ZC_06050, partial [Pirellulaceae bacterium]